MNEPTQEQIKEFWERYGFEDTEYGTLYPDDYNPNDPAGTRRLWDEFPPIDLNNLFKYPPRIMTPALWRNVLRRWVAKVTGDYKKDTLALFWVLWGGN